MTPGRYIFEGCGEGGVFSPGPVIGGALAGILAGVLMGVSWVSYSGIGGLGWATPMQMVAGTFFGPLALIGDGVVVAIGVVTFLAIAAVYGIVFAGLTLWMRSSGMGFWVGIAYAIAVWAFMAYVITPVFDPTLAVREAIEPVWWFFLHWIYGGFLGMFTPWLRGFVAGEVPRYKAPAGTRPA